MRFYDPDTKDRLDSAELFPTILTNQAALRCLKMGLLPSVTTVLDVIREEYLERWFIKEGIEEFKVNGNDAKAAVNHIYTRDSPNAQFGTDCHAVAEAYLLGNDVPDVSDLAKEHAKPLTDWLSKNVKRVITAEKTLASRDLGVAGTVDMAFEHIDGRKIVGDIKVVKWADRYPPNPGMAYRAQLSAYKAMLEEVHDGEFHRLSLYCASPYGWNKKPRLQVFEYERDYLPAFKACRALWEFHATLEDLSNYSGHEAAVGTWVVPKRKKT